MEASPFWLSVSRVDGLPVALLIEHQYSDFLAIA